MRNDRFLVVCHHSRRAPDGGSRHARPLTASTFCGDTRNEQREAFDRRIDDVRQEGHPAETCRANHILLHQGAVPLAAANHYGPSREGRGDGGGGDRRGEAQLRATRGERAVEQGFAIAPPDPPPVRPTHRAQERERRQSQGGRRGRTVRGDVDARSTRRRDRRGKPGERERRGRAFHDPGARTQGPSGRGRNTGRYPRDGACRASPAQSWHPQSIRHRISKITTRVHLPRTTTRGSIRPSIHVPKPVT